MSENLPAISAQFGKPSTEAHLGESLNRLDASAWPLSTTNLALLLDCSNRITARKTFEALTFFEYPPHQFEIELPSGLREYRLPRDQAEAVLRRNFASLPANFYDRLDQLHQKHLSASLEAEKPSKAKAGPQPKQWDDTAKVDSQALSDRFGRKHTTVKARIVKQLEAQGIEAKPYEVEREANGRSIKALVLDAGLISESLKYWEQVLFLQKHPKRNAPQDTQDEDGNVWISSRSIAVAAEKDHSAVVKLIRKQIDSVEAREGQYLDDVGKLRSDYQVSLLSTVAILTELNVSKAFAALNALEKPKAQGPTPQRAKSQQI